MRPKVYKNLNFLLLIVVILIISILATTYTFITIRTSTEQSLLMRSDTIAEFLDVNEIKLLEGNERDLNNPHYQKIKTKLQQVLRVNPDVRFIYLTGKRENKIFFFLDSEPSTSPDYSPPGQVYYEASDKFQNVFINQKPIIEGINKDRWGTWISALTPIVDPETHQAIAVSGMDIDASNYVQTLVAYSLLPSLITLFLLVLVSITFVVKNKEREQMALKAEFVSIAGHEIRSPLSGVIWQLESLINTGELTKTQTETLRVVKNECDNLLKTASDLLDLYSLENKEYYAKPEQVEISLIFEEIVKNFNLFAKEKETQIIVEPCPKILILADKYKLKRMLNNLISNAIKYSLSGGIVKISCEENKGNCIIKIKDNGIGIPVADQEKVFRGFYRSPNARQVTGQGTGLGLYFVKQVVILHQGKIWLESKENAGTTFYVELPKYRSTDKKTSGI